MLDEVPRPITTADSSLYHAHSRWRGRHC
jgi:hypothetical protein